MLAVRSSVAVRPSVASRPARTLAVSCRAHSDSRMPGWVAGVVAASLLSGAFTPEDAYAASSGGRVGGKSGFSSRKAAVSRPSSSSTTVVNNNTVVMGAPMMAPPVYGGFGFGGFHVMPTFFMPIPMFGGLFQLLLAVMAASLIFSVVRGVLGAGQEAAAKKDDKWGDL